MMQDERGYFEQFLQEQTESFRLYPHARVWKSIYNNYHPNRRWPAYSTLLIFILAFLMLDHTPQKEQITETDNNIKAIQVAVVPVEMNEVHINLRPVIKVVPDHPKATTAFLRKKLLPDFQPLQNGLTHENCDEDASLLAEYEISVEDYYTSLESPSEISKINNIKLKPVTETKREAATTSVNVNTASANQETFSYQIYATPSYGYRTFGMNQNPEKNAADLNNNINRTDDKMYANKNEHYSTWNLEAGGALLWSINSMIRLKAGMQLNYSNYSMNENSNAENSAGNMSMASTASFINDNQNQFISSTYQISMPMGTEFELTGNKTLQWYAGATIQPSYLFGNSGINVHSDMNALLQDPNILRRWNVNTSLETYMSYKLKNGLTINAGPQFRYQLLSSFDRSFLYTEKLYNLGVKLGVSKSL
jgi:hypothetical protein